MGQDTDDIQDKNAQDDGTWRIKFHNLECRYYKKRNELYRIVQRYYNQSPHSNYIDERDICNILRDLKTFKTELKEMTDRYYPDTKSALYHPTDFKNYIMIDIDKQVKDRKDPD